ncbi:pre-mRNA-processing protein 45 [Lenzites betulinus]|nr:pre-mRNA-processing protein 45 [Lenzites betulinus]
MAALASLLPTPVNAPVVSDEDDEIVLQPPIQQQAGPSQAVVIRQAVPPYGQRRGWKPTSLEDFGDGGAYPECHVAQYPLNLGKKKTAAGNTLALQVDSEGNVRYDAIALQGQRAGKVVQSQFKDLVPLSHRKDLDEAERALERPTEDEVQATTDKTRAALEKLVNGKIKAAQPKNVPDGQGKTSFIRYTPGQQGNSDSLKQRIIKMTEVVEDPLEPPRFKHKKIPRGPPSPPPPVLRSPPRKATAQEQKEWMIPPCISNWKNNKGYTIPLDKRLAADGRGLQDVHINDNFAKFSEALFVADRHAREEVRQRALMQQKLAEKEKAQKEENLRLLAQRAREERSGIAPRTVEAPRDDGSKPTAARAAAMQSSLGAYGSGSESESEASERDDDEDEEAARVRDQMRAEKRKEREREMRMSNMGTEMRAKMLARQQNRDISEKIALGLAKPTMSKESMLDSRLFNQESLSGNFADDDAYNLYDRPLFHGSSAAAAIYKAHGNISDGNQESYGGGTEEGINQALDNDRFGLGQPRVGFEGAHEQEVREGPVQFEKDTGDVFGLDKFLDEAKTGRKRGLDTEVGGSRKRQQLDNADQRES